MPLDPGFGVWLGLGLHHSANLVLRRAWNGNFRADHNFLCKILHKVAVTDCNMLTRSPRSERDYMLH